MSLIVIDPGHGGIPTEGGDPGALGYRNTQAGTIVAPTEADLNLMFSQVLATQISALGHQIELTRVEDVAVELRTRCALANAKQADIFLSIHHNSFYHPPGVHKAPPSGFEVCYYPGSITGGLAASMNMAVRSKFPGGWKVRDAKERDDLYVLRHTVMPAVLLEIGFISNQSEEILLGMPDFQQRMAGILAKVTDSWLS